jgi:hypothetical protein
MAKYKLIVESGAEKGKTVDVKPEGASIGRSSMNDVSINDELLSRHHCKIYFLGDEVWISDLATLNGTSVNGGLIKEDVKLSVGDTISLGDNTLRLADENGVFPQGKTATPAPGNAEADVDAGRIDLGFTSLDAANDQKANASIKKTLVRAGIAFAAICLVAIAAKLMMSDDDVKGDVALTAVNAPKDQVLEIRYTKLEGSESNVFRYEMVLDSGGFLTVSIDDLNQGKQVRKVSEKPIDKDLKQEIIRKFEIAGFFALDHVYEGIPRQNTWNAFTLTGILDGQTKTVAVRNRIEPEAFKTLREEIETFGRNELGLWAVEFSREKLIELANESLIVAQKLYDEREIRLDNLFNSIRSFKSCIAYLDTLEPKPEFYDRAVSSLAVAENDLEKIFKEKNWQAEHAMNTKNWETAAATLREIMEIIPDRTDERNRDVERRLLDVESRIKKLRK